MAPEACEIKKMHRGDSGRQHSTSHSSGGGCQGGESRRRNDCRVIPADSGPIAGTLFKAPASQFGQRENQPVEPSLKAF